VPSEVAVKKQRAELDQHMTTIHRRVPFVLDRTVGQDGGCDVSPRGDAAGALQSLDPRTLVIPGEPVIAAPTTCGTLLKPDVSG
jgi:hypothetical protein